MRNVTKKFVTQGSRIKACGTDLECLEFVLDKTSPFGPLKLILKKFPTIGRKFLTEIVFDEFKDFKPVRSCTKKPVFYIEICLNDKILGVKYQKNPFKIAAALQSILQILILEKY